MRRALLLVMVMGSCGVSTIAPLTRYDADGFLVQCHITVGMHTSTLHSRCGDPDETIRTYVNRTCFAYEAVGRPVAWEPVALPTPIGDPEQPSYLLVCVDVQTSKVASVVGVDRLPSSPSSARPGGNTGRRSSPPE